MKQFGIVLFALGVFLSLHAKETIKLGMILPLSGENESIGAECRVGIKILQEELKSRELAFDYEFLFEDDQMTPKLTAMAAQKLMRVDKVDALFPLYSGPSNVCKPFCQKDGVPMIGMGASDTRIPDNGFCFTNAADPEKESIRFLQTMRALGYKKLAMLSIVQQGAILIKGKVIAHSKDEGVEIVSDINYNPGERDFKTIWLKIREAKPDLILVQALDPEYGIIWRNRKQMGIETPVASIEWFACTNAISEIPENAWQIAMGSSIFKTGFDKKVAAVDSRINNFVNSAIAYDSPAIIINACETWAKFPPPGTTKLRKPTGVELAGLIRSLPYSGALGKLEVDKQGVIDSEAGLWLVEKGVLKPVELSELKSKLGK